MNWTDAALDSGLAKLAEYVRLPQGVAGDPGHYVVTYPERDRVKVVEHNRRMLRSVTATMLVVQMAEGYESEVHAILGDSANRLGERDADVLDIARALHELRDHRAADDTRIPALERAHTEGVPWPEHAKAAPTPLERVQREYATTGSRELPVGAREAGEAFRTLQEAEDHLKHEDPSEVAIVRAAHVFAAARVAVREDGTLDPARLMAALNLEPGDQVGELNVMRFITSFMALKNQLESDDAGRSAGLVQNHPKGPDPDDATPA